MYVRVSEYVCTWVCGCVCVGKDIQEEVNDGDAPEDIRPTGVEGTPESGGGEKCDQ